MIAYLVSFEDGGLQMAESVDPKCVAVTLSPAQMSCQIPIAFLMESVYKKNEIIYMNDNYRASISRKSISRVF